MLSSRPVARACYVLSSSPVARACYVLSSSPVARASQSQLRELGAEPWASVFTLKYSSSLSSMKEYLVIYRGGYWCTNSLCRLIAPWLDAFQRSRYGVRLNPEEWILRYGPGNTLGAAAYS